MKKLLSLVLVFIICFTLFACGDETTTYPTTTTTKNNTTTITTANSTTSTTTTNDAATTTENETTTTTENNATTTTKPAATTTTTKPTTTSTTKKADGARKDGVINEPVTKTVSLFSINEQTYEVGKKQTRIVTYKGTIKIGNTAASTGAYASVGVPFNVGLESYLNKINFNGGIGGDYASGKQGYYIEFIHYDDGFSSTSGATYTKKLVEEDKVFALVGHFGSPTVGATIDYIKEQGVVACYMASGVAELFNIDADTVQSGSTIFPVQPIYSTEGRIIVGRIIEQYPDARKIGIIYTSDEVGLGIKEGAVAQINAVGEDYKCVTSKATSNVTNYTSAVNKVADCDVVVVASVQRDAVNILKSMITNGVYKPVFLSYSLASASTLTDIKSYYDALDDSDKFPIYANAWLSSTDVEAYLEFCADILASTGSNETLNNSYAIAGWISATIFCEGLERVIEDGDEINNLTYVEAMESKKIFLKMGASSTIDSMLNYANGYRLGTTTMSLLVSNDTCNAFVEAANMKNFHKFITTGNPNKI